MISRTLGNEGATLVALDGPHVSDPSLCDGILRYGSGPGTTQTIIMDGGARSQLRSNLKEERCGEVIMLAQVEAFALLRQCTFDLER